MRVGKPFASRPLPRVLLLLLLLWLAAGCAAQALMKGELAPPKVEVQGVTPLAPTRDGWPLTLTLHLTNPNSQAISISGYSYEIWLEGQQALTGQSRQGVSLPALGTATVNVPVLVKWQALPQVLPAVLARQRVRYEVVGGVGVPQLLGFRVPFRFRGELPVEGGLEQLAPFLR
jgi:LEA14-like dessication related protein